MRMLAGIRAAADADDDDDDDTLPLRTAPGIAEVMEILASGSIDFTYTRQKKSAKPER